MVSNAQPDVSFVVMLLCYLKEDAEETNEPTAISGTVEIMWHSCNDYPGALD